MKIRLLSDIHLELHAGWIPPQAEADVVVLAGDVSVGTQGLYWARDIWPDTPIVYVMGNHEFYGRHLNGTLVEARGAAGDLGIHLLENDQVVIDGVRFLGCTLWTDFALDGLSQAHQAMGAAQHFMSDYSQIRTHLGWLNPVQTVQMHLASVDWLTTKLQREHHDGATVVVTHHLPHRACLDPADDSSALNPAFASDLERLLGFSDLWLFGHKHHSVDLKVADTRLVCNPRGYADAEFAGAAGGNADFDEVFVLEL